MSWIQTRRRAQEAPAGRSMEDTLRRQMAWAAGTEQFQHRDPLYHVTESFQQIAIKLGDAATGKVVSAAILTKDRIKNFISGGYQFLKNKIKGGKIRKEMDTEQDQDVKKVMG